MAFDQRYQPGAIPQFGSFGPPNMSAQLQAGISRLADPFIARLRELQVANEAAAARKDTESIFKTAPTAMAGAPGTAPAQTATGGTPSGGEIHAPLAQANPEVRDTFLKTVEAGGLKNPYGLAAVAATGQAETSWSPGRVNTAWNDLGKPSGGTLSWRAERLQAMRKFTQGAEDPVAAQAQFFLQENPALIARLNEAKSPEEANTLMANAWRYKGYNQPGTGEFARREGLTRQYAAKLGTAAPAPAEAPTASFAPSVVPAPTPAAQAAVAAPGPAMDAATGRAIPPNDPRLQTPEFDRVHGQAPTQVASLDPSIGIGQRQATPEVTPQPPARPQSFGPDGQPLPPQQQPAPALPSGPPPNEQPTPPPPPPVQPPPPPIPAVAPVEPPPPAPMAALPTPAAPPVPRVAPAVAPSPEQPVAAGGPQQPPVSMAQAAPQQGQRYVAPVDPVAERFWLTQLKHAKTREEVVAIGQKLMELRQGQKPTVHITPQGLVEYRPDTGTARLLTQSPDRAPKTAKGPDGRAYAWNENTGRYDTPVGGPGAAGAAPMFAGNSVEGQGLNHLVQRGILTRDQAATVAAGKTVTDPSTNTQFFIPPQDLARGGSVGVVARTPDGAITPVVPQSMPAAPAAPAPSPGGVTAVPPPTPGAVQLTPPKADKPDNPSAEAAARVSLGNTFLKEVPAIRQQIEAGVLDSPKARAALVTGYGDPGSIARRMASGRDALLRAMTGAGMNLSEAADYVKRYELSWRDDRRNFLEKLEGLERDIIAVREGVVAGRKITAPALTGPQKSPSSGGFTTPGGTRFEEVR